VFAIKISEENEPLILDNVPPQHIVEALRLFGNKRDETWYVISNYINARGALTGWKIFPSFVLKDGFDIDLEKAETDWTQMVRKEIPE
jgi:hypothetical protein